MQSQTVNPPLHLAPQTPETSRRPLWFGLALGVALLAIPLLFRVPLITQSGAVFSVFDLSGMLRDCAILCILVVLVAALRMRLGHLVLLVLMIAFLIIETGNAGFIWAFGDTIDLSQAGFILDKTFLLGSATKIQNPTAFGISAIAILLVFVLARRVQPVPRIRWIAGLGVGALCLSFLLPGPRGVPPWQQSGILTQNALSFVELFQPETAPSLPKREMATVYAALDQELAGDMSGKRWLELPAGEPQDHPNILLIILEGLSGAYFPDLAEAQGLESNIKMPQLEAFAKKGVIFSQFFSHQRQTTRGTYALLCGKLPRFSSGKSRLEITADTNTALDCLPGDLAKLGYHRSYLQSAPLPFTRKDEALPLIGYQDTAGAKSFDPADVGSSWGPHDGVLFNRALRKMNKLDAAPAPWFMTVLNVGTHHPYNMVPTSFVGNEDANIRSFEYLDVAVSEFLTKAKADKLLENTLVIITSDESNGLRGESSDAIQELVRNWSVLAMVAPGKLTPRVDDRIAGQFDLPLSVLDLLDVPAPPHYSGRSLFRDYATPRKLYAYNNIRHQSYVIAPDSIEMCSKKASTCQTLQKSGEGLGTLKPVDGAPEAELQTTAQNLILYTNREVVLMDREILPEGTEVTVTPDDPYLLCCHYSNLPKKHTFSFDTELQLLSDDPATIHIDIVSNLDGTFSEHYSQKFAFLPGETLSIGHILKDAGPLKRIELRMRLASDVPEARFLMSQSSMRMVKDPE